MRVVKIRAASHVMKYKIPYRFLMIHFPKLPYILQVVNVSLFLLLKLITFYALNLIFALYRIEQVAESFFRICGQ
jgi:hypothetical protein